MSVSSSEEDTVNLYVAKFYRRVGRFMPATVERAEIPEDATFAWFLAIMLLGLAPKQQCGMLGKAVSEDTLILVSIWQFWDLAIFFTDLQRQDINTVILKTWTFCLPPHFCLSCESAHTKEDPFTCRVYHIHYLFPVFLCSYSLCPFLHLKKEELAGHWMTWKCHVFREYHYIHMQLHHHSSTWLCITRFWI